MQQLDPKAVWLFFFRGISRFLILLVILCIALLKLIITEWTSLASFVFWAVAVIVVGLIWCFVWSKLFYRSWRYELTDDAIKVEKGVIWKKYTSIPYERIQNIDIYRGLLGRMLGLSDLQVQTAGYSTYGNNRNMSEGRFFGLKIQVAEELREQLIKRAKGTKQGL
ncbi:MAG: PH domain-containing protein [Patescibacteria group bacterium]|nr:PH domain-containing protein [Patescibacteria group bacterium]MDD5121509.1 PH domain-containing protein [Patescibacteria group bacterium]MDD5222047.1 PH domain-containing protein [Patescibacteria group bacterium]MDD5396329.1 PH domain-containing protein [Patescibacteria group bacterium]